MASQEGNARIMLRLIRTTIVGGIIFLIPIAILIAVIAKGLQATGVIARPVAAVFPVYIGGIAVAQVLAIVFLLLICFMAGLLARLALARKAVDALETNVLSRLPAYALLKTKTQSMLSPEDIEGMSVVVMRFDDSWQIGFEIERVEGGKVALFLPGSPDPWSGSVCIAPGRPCHAPRSARGGRRQHGETAWKGSKRSSARSSPLDRARGHGLKPARPFAARRIWAASGRRTLSLLMRRRADTACAGARLRHGTARLPWSTPQTGSPKSCRRCLYCSAIDIALNGRMSASTSAMVSGSHSRRCSHTGGL
jgi:uncharacterized membrane protein